MLKMSDGFIANIRKKHHATPELNNSLAIQNPTRTLPSPKITEKLRNVAVLQPNTCITA
jgi:hypothetical protein